MSTPRRGLKPEESAQLAQLSRELLRSWAKGKAADLSTLLGNVNGSLRALFLYELIRTDLEMRYRHQRPVMLEEYVGQFPSFLSTKTLPPELIYEEYSARRLYGDAPPLDSYRTRFPDQFEQLRELSERHSSGTLRGNDDRTPTPPRPLDVEDALPPTSDPMTVRTVPPLPKPLGPDSGSPRTVAPGKADASGDDWGSADLPIARLYKMQETIGRGEFGQVYRALAPGGVPVAIKRLFRPIQDDSCQREQQALELIKSLRHTYLLQTHAYWIEKGQLYIVMELADGSLHDWFVEARAQGLPGIPKPELLTYFGEVAEALDFLHVSGVIHRDIKPANLLRMNGHAKVSDFGLARMYKDDHTDGTLCGTPRYMAPEVWDEHVSGHLDQYSLALAFMDMAVDRNMAKRQTFEAVKQLHVGGKHDFTGFAKAEEAVLRKALSVDPNNRYPTCTDFIAALKQANEPAKVDARVGFVQWLAPVLMGALLLGLVGWGIFGRGGPKPSVTREGSAPRLPKGFRAGEGHTGKGYPERIVYEGLKGVEIEFVLIPDKQQANGLPPFWISRDKITNKQYWAGRDDPRWKALEEALEKDQRMQKLRAELNKEKAPQPRPNHRNRKGDAKWEKLPVFEVTGIEAYVFSQLLGGHLPTGKQWDQAGGAIDDQPGPFDGEFEVPPNRGPVPSDWHPKDVSIYKVRGMAATGKEYTQDVYYNFQLLRFPAQVLGHKNLNFSLRGCTFKEDKEVKEDKEDKLFRFNRAGPPDSHEYWDWRSDVGFRVVVEPPSHSQE